MQKRLKITLTHYTIPYTNCNYSLIGKNNVIPDILITAKYLLSLNKKWSQLSIEFCILNLPKLKNAAVLKVYHIIFGFSPKIIKISLHPISLNREKVVEGDDVVVGVVEEGD